MTTNAYRSSVVGPRSPVEALLTVEGLTTVFDLAAGPAAAVIDVSAADSSMGSHGANVLHYPP